MTSLFTALLSLKVRTPSERTGKCMHEHCTVDAEGRRRFRSSFWSRQPARLTHLERPSTRFMARRDDLAICPSKMSTRKKTDTSAISSR
uniref:Secreted protein n=1 Tax=Steinernema glaseri TaxID=37863 RepID=A0A1I7YEW0_9BILA